MIKIDETSIDAVKALVPAAIDFANAFIELNPTCSIDIKLATYFSHFRLMFNDARNNSVTYSVKCFDTPDAFTKWNTALSTIATDGYSDLIACCFKGYYKEDGTIRRTALAELSDAINI